MGVMARNSNGLLTSSSRPAWHISCLTDSGGRGIDGLVCRPLRCCLAGGTGCYTHAAPLIISGGPHGYGPLEIARSSWSAPRRRQRRRFASSVNSLQAPSN
jgi:hypothetical protein